MEYICLRCHRPMHIRQINIISEAVLPSTGKRKKGSKNNVPPIVCEACGSRIAVKTNKETFERKVNAI